MERYYLLATAWSLLSPFQYGYHTASLNQIQRTLTCANNPSSAPFSRPTGCIPMSDAVFGFVTSSFTLGGFLGSFAAAPLLDKYGRRGVLVINSLVVATGSIIFGLSTTVEFLILGRFLVGVGCGLGLCAVPLYLAETAPAHLRDRVGVLNQLVITIGILATQAIGLPLAKRSEWRPVMTISTLLALVTAATSIFIYDTPAWLSAKGRHSESVAATRRLHGSKGEANNGGAADPERDDRSALLAPEQRPASPPDPSSAESLNITTLLRRPDLFNAVFIVSFAMLAQQGSGINAVIYYSTDILQQALKTDGAYISLLISVVNIVMTFAPVILIQRFGTKRLLMFSIFGEILAAVVLGYALDTGAISLSIVAIVAFIAFFALGLGPVPFMLTSELVPYQATSALSSLALAVNWSSNFVVASGFLPLRNLLAGGGGGDNESGQGRVFYVFGFILTFAALMLNSLYKQRQ